MTNTQIKTRIETILKAKHVRPHWTDRLIKTDAKSITQYQNVAAAMGYKVRPIAPGSGKNGRYDVR